MNILNELVDYCMSPYPDGALLIDGDQGCGKTYLIEHDLREQLNGNAYIVRISLSGISDKDALNDILCREWVKTIFSKKNPRIGKLGKIVTAINNLSTMPKVIKDVTSLQWISIFVTSTINEKPVILVFDDLERCCMNSTILLEVINDYSENQRFHTIIIADWNKLLERNDEKPDAFSYMEEKVIRKTIRYAPSIDSMICLIAEEMRKTANGMPYVNDYYAFINKYSTNLSGLIYEYESGDLKDFAHVSFRRLSRAVKDFYRIYEVLKECNSVCTDKYFYNYISLCLTSFDEIHSADFSERNYPEKEVYSIYFGKYTLSAVQRWIDEGIWNREQLITEIKDNIMVEHLSQPAYQFVSNCVEQMEEDIVNSGYKDAVIKAHESKFMLDEYEWFIMNCAWLRQSGFKMDEPIDWEKVKEGILNSMDKTLNGDYELRNRFFRFSYFEEDIKLSIEEAEAFGLIKDFRSKNKPEHIKSRKNYIFDIQKDPFETFRSLMKESFNVFDDDMAVATVKAYKGCSNSDKQEFLFQFSVMWGSKILSETGDIKVKAIGFELLARLLEEYAEEEKAENRVIAGYITQKFVSKIKWMIERASV